MSKYRNISAVGQINNMACWAACLKWWYRSSMSINASQTTLYNMYKNLATQENGMTDSGMKHVIRQNGMELLEYGAASEFTWDRVKKLLNYGPIYTAYTETQAEKDGSIKRHVNVIYEINGDGPWADVRVMEPQASEAGGGAFKGKHLTRSLSNYNIVGSVWAGVHREKYFKDNSY